MSFSRSILALVLLGFVCPAIAPGLHAQTTATGGSLDPTFNTLAGPNNRVRAIAVQADGKILAGGDFTSINGVSRNLVARFNADGRLDTTFASPPFSPAGAVYSLTVQPDGRILVAGVFFLAETGVAKGVVRLRADGTLDRTFDTGVGPGAGGGVFALALQPDGRAVVGGSFTTFNQVAANDLVRLNVDGSLDFTFNAGSGTPGVVLVLRRQPNGRFLVGGDFTRFSAGVNAGLTRINANGSPDGSFPSTMGDFSTVLAVALQADGRFLLSKAGGLVERDTAAGFFDPTFVGDAFAFGNVFALAVDANGRILLGGDFTSYNGVNRRGLTRLNPDGSTDRGFDPGAGADGTVRAIAIQPDGNLLIGGDFGSYGGVARPFLARVAAGPPSAGVVSFAASSYSVAESAGTLAITVNRLGSAVGTIRVPYAPASSTAGDPAVEGVDFTGGNGTLTFEEGVSSRTFTLTLLDNAAPQANRTLALALGAPGGGAALGSPAATIVTITDDDFPPVLTGEAAASGAQGQPFSYPIIATNAPTAFAANGLPAGLTLDPASGVISGVPAAPGVFVVSLSAGNAAGVGTGVLTLTIAPPPAPVLSVVATAPEAFETGRVKGEFTVSRPAGSDLSAALTVLYKVSGSALGGVQYKALPGSVVLPAGSATAKVKVKPIDDGASASGDTVVKLKLLPGGGYLVGTPPKAKVTVRGDGFAAPMPRQ